MKSLAQLPDLVDSLTRHVAWEILCLQQAAMEDRDSIMYTAAGDAIYITSAPEHGRSLAIAVRSRLLPCLRHAHCHGRYMCVDFAFQNGETRIAKMRVGNAHLPPQGGSHSEEECPTVVQEIESNGLNLGRRSLSMWGIETHV